MPRRRVARLNEQLKREISEIVRTQLRDPRVTDVTVTGVAVAADLSSARIFVRALEAEGARTSVVEGLGAAAPFVRRELGRRLTLRRVPELLFQWDRSMESARRIEEILTDVRPEGGWIDEDEGDEGSL